MRQVFTVTGMTCGHCEMAVSKAIRRVDPAAPIFVDRSHDRVEVESDAPRQALKDAIEFEGYTVTP